MMMAENSYNSVYYTQPSFFHFYSSNPISSTLPLKNEASAEGAICCLERSARLKYASAARHATPVLSWIIIIVYCLPGRFSGTGIPFPYGHSMYIYFRISHSNILTYSICGILATLCAPLLMVKQVDSTSTCQSLHKFISK